MKGFEDEFHPYVSHKLSMTSLFPFASHLLQLPSYSPIQKLYFLKSSLSLFFGLSRYAKHDGRGILSMANKGANENKSQFFITYGKQFHLNNQNSVFGKVVYIFFFVNSASVVVEAFSACRSIPALSSSFLSFVSSCVYYCDVVSVPFIIKLSLHDVFPVETLPVSNLWQVIDGMDTLDYMEKVPVDKKYRPTQEIKIKSVTIHANPLA
jgi:cyclophilin family peptidyl-prolyl cis-trans isomerase